MKIRPGITATDWLIAVVIWAAAVMIGSVALYVLTETALRIAPAVLHHFGYAILAVALYFGWFYGKGFFEPRDARNNSRKPEAK